MSTQIRAPRAKVSNGKSLIFLGVFLALISGGLVFYVLSTASSGAHQITVVVANKSIPKGSILDANGNDQAPYVSLDGAFKPVNIPSTSAPADALPYTTDNIKALNNYVVVGDIQNGDIIHKPDARLQPAGSASGTSEVNIDPQYMPAGDVIIAVHGVSNAVGAQQGDYVDILATLCLQPNQAGYKCVNSTTTTMENLRVYAVDQPTKGTILLAVSHQDALVLKYLEDQGSNLEFVIRNPSDTAPAGTTQIDSNYIQGRFKLDPPVAGQ